MTIITEQVNKKIQKKTVIISAVAFALVAGISAYFGIAYYRLYAECDAFKKAQAGFDEFSKRIGGINANFSTLEQNYTQLQNDFNAVKTDRDNLLVQIKGLLAERGRAQELEAAMGTIKSEDEVLRKDNEDLEGQNTSFKDEIKRLEVSRVQIASEVGQLKDALATAQSKSGEKKMQQGIALLQKENSSLGASLRQAQAEAAKWQSGSYRSNDQINTLKRQVAELRAQLTRLNVDYNVALNKNRALERKALEIPAKFQEIARQNTVLMKQTANMHYNLGVFYLNTKEYARAVVEFEKSIEINPDDAYAQFNLGYIYAEYLVDRRKAIEHFRHYLKIAKKDDKDFDWVKKYVLTWDTWGGKKPME